MKILKEKAFELLGNYPECRIKLEKIKDDYVYIEVLSQQRYKTLRQNSLFHSLLTVFWKSGCSSYISYDEMRLAYKRFCGLVKNKEGRIVESSWSEATKEQARQAIDMLLQEMDMSGVLGSSVGKKYEEILKGIGDWYE